MAFFQQIFLGQEYALIGMAQIALSAILGGAIGLERELSGRDAGFRTIMLVCIGSTLFTILSIHGFPLGGSASQDTARIAAQIVSGVGFLGAGALFQNQRHTKGLTTAASIWLVSAIGMAVGTGGYIIAIFTTVVALLALHFLQPVSKMAAPSKQSNPKELLSDEEKQEAE